MTGYHDSAPFGALTQNIATIPGVTYHLSLSLGTGEDSALFQGPVGVYVVAGLSSAGFTFTPSGVGNQWGDFGYDFLAHSSVTDVTIYGVSAAHLYLGLDNVSVTPVPEPAYSVAAMAAILGGYALCRTVRR